MKCNEASTRKDVTDSQIAIARWNLNDSQQVWFEIPLSSYDADPWNSVTDYCLYRAYGEVAAIVEAQRQSRRPQVTYQQVRHYVLEIAGWQVFNHSRLWLTG